MSIKGMVVSAAAGSALAPDASMAATPAPIADNIVERQPSPGEGVRTRPSQLSQMASTTSTSSGVSMRSDSAPSEKGSKPYVREARSGDIKRLVEIDFECFQDVYEANPVDPKDVYAMMATRMATIQQLFIVGEIDGVIEGVMACQRTDRNYSEVKSWEETTNNGTLDGTHMPSGKYFYVVNLAVTGKGSKHDLSDQLIAMMLGRFIAVQGEIAQLLSRIPQFSEWLDEKHIDFDSLSADVQDKWAEEYVKATKVIDGKERLYDGVLQRYVEVGVRPMAVLRDGYSDPSSRNYGVLCTFENPLPNVLKRNRIISLLVGGVIRYAANRPKLLNILPY